jgi:hypothetical protein
MPLFLVFNTQTMRIKSKTHNSIAMFLLHNFIPRRNSNPGLLSLRLMQYPLRAMPPGHFENYFSQKHTKITRRITDPSKVIRLHR